MSAPEALQLDFAAQELSHTMVAACLWILGNELEHEHTLCRIAPTSWNPVLVEE